MTEAFEWITQALLEIDEGRGYRAASKLVDVLKETWRVNGDMDPWETVWNIFDESWKATRRDYFDDDSEDLINDTEWREAFDLEDYT